MIIRLLGLTLAIMMPLHMLAKSALGFVHFTPAQGLPSSTIYEIYQDSKGYIWLGTEGGLCKYDGYQFHTYTVADGLPGNDVFQIKEDAKGTLHILGLGKISQMSGDSIRIIHELGQLSASVLGDLEILGDDIYLLQVNRSTPYFYRLRGESFQRIDASHFTGDSLALDNNFSRIPDGILLTTNQGILHIRPDQAPQYYPVPGQSLKGTVKGNYVSGKGLLMETAQGIAYFDQGQFTSAFPQSLPEGSLRTLHEDRQGNLWIASNRGGLWLVTPQSRETDTPLLGPYLSGETVNKIHEDVEGNIWIGTMRNGIYFLPWSAQYCQNFSSQNGLMGNSVESLCRLDSETVLLGYDNGSWASIHKGVIQNHPLPRYPAYQRIMGLATWSQGRYLAGTDHGLYILQQGKAPFRWINGSIKKIITDPQGDIWIASRLGIIRLPRDYEGSIAAQSSIADSPFKIDNGRTYGLYYQSGKEQLWMGKVNGLESLKGGKKTDHSQQHPAFASTIKDLLMIDERYLLAGSDGFGLIVLDTQAPDKAWDIPEVGKRIVYALHLDPQGGLWVGCTDGLVYLPDFQPTASSHPAYYLGSRDGLITNEIRAILKQGNQVYVATSGGLSLISMDLFSRQGEQALPVYLSEASIGDDHKLLQSGANLNYDQNRLNFAFIALNYASQGDIQYRYRLKGLEADWQYSKQQEAKYPSLPPGDYTFEVAAKPHNGTWTSQTAGIDFSISMPFYMSLGFFLLLAFAAIILIALIFWLRLRSINRRNAERVAYEKKINGLQLKALGSKISPMFIFNSMDAVQRRIVEHKEEEAHAYLRKFSHLVRVLTLQSRKSRITLSEELRTVELLLELEQQRLGGTFTSRIRTEPGLHPDEIHIPPTLIQPYVEDAIRQGLEPRGAGGHLEIRILQTPTKLNISVRDNGISDRAATLASTYDQAKTQAQQAGRQKLGSYELLSPEGVQVRVTPQKEGHLVEISVDYERIKSKRKN